MMVIDMCVQMMFQDTAIFSFFTMVVRRTDQKDK